MGPGKIRNQVLAQSQGQNLVNPIRVERVERPGKPVGFYKLIILDLCSALAAFFVGYAYLEFTKGIWSFAILFGVFLAAIVVSALQVLFEKSVWRRIGILLIEIVAFLVLFHTQDPKLIGISAAIIFLFFVLGYTESRSELNHGMTIRFFSSTHGVAAKTVTALLLAGVVLYVPHIGSGPIFINESAFTVIFDWAAGLAGNFYPTLSLSGSLTDFSASVAKESLSGNATFSAMSPDDQKATLSAATIAVEGNLSKFFSVASTPSSTMNDVAYQSIVSALRAWRARSLFWFSLAWGISVFLVLRAIGVIMVWIGQFFTMIVYELLLAAGAIRITEESQTKEVIGFS